MISAFEAKLVSTAITEEKKVKEQLDKQLRAERARDNAVIFCETFVNEKIMEAMQNGRHYIFIPIEDNYEGYCYRLTEKKRTYQNGDSSWERAGLMFDFTEAKRILQSVGYSITLLSATYKRYSWGTIKAYDLHISW